MKLLIYLAFVGAALAVPKNQQRIMGGEATSIEQYPYMSNMQYAHWGFLWAQECGGSLITTTAVISSAFCYIGDSANEWRVLLGSTSASSGGTIHPVSQIITHAEYNAVTFDYDIAVIKLSVAATISNVVSLAKIAGPDFRQLTDGGALTAIGWGSIHYGGSGTTQLRHVDINVINQEVCAERYAYLNSLSGYQNWPTVTDRMLCAGILNEGGKDTCGGDRGGPLVFNDVVVGITSWGYGCGNNYYPSVYTRVSSLANWIVSNAI